MSGETNLQTLIRTMNPELSPETYVYCTVPYADANITRVLQPHATYREKEGLTLILTQQDAEQAGLPYNSAMRCITLNVHSALEAVGLTAAIATTLSQNNISANVIAAYYHDHVFVPDADANRALAALQALSAA
jgi:hypothetical protein